MAREAYRSIYGDLTKLKDDSLLKDPANGTDDDDEMFQLLLAVSEWVDLYCNRHFYPRAQTLYFDAPHDHRLIIPDLISIDSIRQDQDGSGSWALAWPEDSYYLEPYNAAPTRPWGGPFTVVSSRHTRPWADTPSRVRSIEIAATWGYRRFAEDSSTDLNQTSLAATGATVTVDDGTQFHVGQTILIDDEQMLVTAISTNNLTVTRGLNGTTASAHDDNSDVLILRWPPAVERAALIQSARIWTRAADFEPYFVAAELDTDVRMFLDPYRKLAL